MCIPRPSISRSPVAAAGTVAEDATAELVLLPVSAHCTGCGATWECERHPVVVSDCGGVDIELIGGDELVLESIEYRG